VTAAEWWRELRRTRTPLWRFSPEPRMAMAVAVIAPLWLIPGSAGNVIGLVAVGLLLVLTVIDVLLLPPRGGIRIEREVAESVGIGDVESGRYSIANRTGHVMMVSLQDALPALVDGGIHKVVVTLPPRAIHHEPFSMRGMVRGRAQLGAVGLRMCTRIGLVSVRETVALDDLVKVLPSVAGVRSFRLLAMQHRLDTVGIRALRRKGEGLGFAGLREYAAGDEPRHIDWKATARHAKLITREFTIERSQTVITLIDAGRSMTQRAGTYTRFEQALNSALVLTDVAVNAGDRVGTLVFDDEVRAFVPALQSKGALRIVRDAYVPVVASTREPDYATAFRYLATHQRKRALIVFFTDVIDVRASRSLLAHVAGSASRHLTLVVALRNDDVFAAARPSTAGSGALAVYQAAAAEEVIQAREEALERMRRAGVVVVDVSPAMMTAGVVNRYLELKARGAL
jgi:uncharacterized protein (DUF58 family)